MEEDEEEEEEDEEENFSLRQRQKMVPLTSPLKPDAKGECPRRPGKEVSLLTKLTESGAIEVLEYAIALGRADYLVDGEDPGVQITKTKLRKLRDSTRKFIKIASQSGQTAPIAALWTEFRESRFLLTARLLSKLALDGENDSSSSFRFFLTFLTSPPLFLSHPLSHLLQFSRYRRYSVSILARSGERKQRQAPRSPSNPRGLRC